MATNSPYLQVKVDKLRTQRNILLAPWVILSFPVSVPLLLAAKRRRKARDRAIAENTAHLNFVPRKAGDMHAAHVLSSFLWRDRTQEAEAELEARVASPDVTPEAKTHGRVFLATWRYFQGDVAGARALLEEAPDHDTDVFLRPVWRMTLAQLYLWAGEAAKAAQVMETVRFSTVSSADRILMASTDDSDAGRLAGFNAIFEWTGFSTLKKRDEAQPLSMSNIEASEDLPPVEDGPKVTVILPTYNAEDTLSRAVRSVQEQTYRNLEIVIVDDCSTDDTYNVAQSIAATDPRVRVMRQPKNAGAYPARNAGLAVAAGELICTHDADDWSHPERVATQVSALVDDPELEAVGSHWCRTTEALHYRNWELTTRVILKNFSALMYRRRVFDRFGGWDNIRVSADADLPKRIETYVGKHTIRWLHPDTPLAFGLFDEGSLTNTKATHVKSVRHGLRHYYHQLSDYWYRTHETFEKDDQAARLALLPQQMFQKDVPRPEVDLCLVGDFTWPVVVEKMRSMTESVDGRIGVYYRPDFLPMRPSEFTLCDEFFEFVQERNAELVLSLESVDAKKILEVA